MKEIIVFAEEGGDPFLYKEIDYSFSIGDLVYYFLTPEERKRLKERGYHKGDCKGVISDKWIDLNKMEIHWTVEIDCELKL